MATTKIWAVKDSLSRLVKYAENPEKTICEDLQAVVGYAKDEGKTLYEEGETCYLVTSLHCRGDALESMMKVHNHFEAKGENIAYHAYQSFKPGEVSAQQCHEIGVKLAEQLWRNHQVLVATHTNKEHLHNHFVILSTSFKNGKKLDIGGNYWRRVLVPASDRICAEYGLSVLGERGKAAPRLIYFAEKRGEATPYRLMAEAMQTALRLANDKEELWRYLFDLGYHIDTEYECLKSRFNEKWVSLEKLQDLFKMEITSPYFENYFAHNQKFVSAEGNSYEERQRYIRNKNGYYKQKEYRQKGTLEVNFVELNTIGKVLYVFLSILGWLPEQRKNGERYVPLSPECKAFMRAEERKMEMYSHSAVILDRENLKTAEQVLDYIDGKNEHISKLVKHRKQLYYLAAKAKTPEGREHLLGLIARENDALKSLRYDKKCLINVLERSGAMQEMIQNELQMRREKRVREYLPDDTRSRMERARDQFNEARSKSKRRDDYER